LFVFLLSLELTGGDGDKKDGSNDEEDPEVFEFLFFYFVLFVIINLSKNLFN